VNNKETTLLIQSIKGTTSFDVVPLLFMLSFNIVELLFNVVELLFSVVGLLFNIVVYQILS
jgi:hypothetical protein